MHIARKSIYRAKFTDAQIGVGHSDTSGEYALQLHYAVQP